MRIRRTEYSEVKIQFTLQRGNGQIFEEVNLKPLQFLPQAKLKGPLRSFIVVVLVVAGESFWNEQKMFAMEQKILLEQNYGIDLPVWPCMALYSRAYMGLYDIL